MTSYEGQQNGGVKLMRSKDRRINEKPNKIFTTDIKKQVLDALETDADSEKRKHIISTLNFLVLSNCYEDPHTSLYYLNEFEQKFPGSTDHIAEQLREHAEHRVDDPKVYIRCLTASGYHGKDLVTDPRQL